MKMQTTATLARHNSVRFQNNPNSEVKSSLKVRSYRRLSAGSLYTERAEIQSIVAVMPPTQKIKVQVTGITHVVAVHDNSLMNSHKDIQVIDRDVIHINTKKSIMSRRGPNQELYDQMDQRSKHQYQWFEVLSVNNIALIDDTYFIREDTFVTDEGKSIQDLSMTHASDYRLRRAMIPVYDFPFVSRHQQYSRNAIACLKWEMVNLKNNHLDPCLDIKGFINTFRSLLCSHLGGTFASCLYGSYATESQRPGSDIDILFACDNQTYRLYHRELLPILKDFVEFLHDSVGASVDDEVPPESKLLVSAQELMEAAAGKIYYPDFENKNKILQVPPLSDFLEKPINMDGIKKSESKRFSDEFLMSNYFLKRLLLNILTTPHDFQSNHSEALKQIMRVAENTLSRLSEDLKQSHAHSDPLTVEHLFTDAQGNTGEMYLGYKADRPHVKKTLIENINSSRA
jgi:predicted nucleotidyltransferase